MIPPQKKKKKGKNWIYLYFTRYARHVSLYYLKGTFTVMQCRQLNSYTS